MNSNLSAAEICAVIKTCGECGVTRFKLGPLSLEFLPKSEAPKLTATPATLPDTEISEAQFAEDHDRRLLESESELRERQLAELAITDPLAYEELLAHGELESKSPKFTDSFQPSRS